MLANSLNLRPSSVGLWVEKSSNPSPDSAQPVIFAILRNDLVENLEVAAFDGGEKTSYQCFELNLGFDERLCEAARLIHGFVHCNDRQ
jgi:hypothetical protein